MVDKIAETLWRGHRRRLEGQISEYAGMLRMIEGRLLRMRGRLKRVTGDAAVQLAIAIRRLESDHEKIAEGWQAILKVLDHTLITSRKIAHVGIDRADSVLAEGSRRLTTPVKALQRVGMEAAALKKGIEVGLRRGRRMAAVVHRRRAARSKA